MNGNDFEVDDDNQEIQQVREIRKFTNPFRKSQQQVQQNSRVFKRKSFSITPKKHTTKFSDFLQIPEQKQIIQQTKEENKCERPQSSQILDQYEEKSDVEEPQPLQKKSTIILDQQIQLEEDDEDVQELTEEEAKHAALFKWAKEHHEYSALNSYEQIMQFAKDFKPIQCTEESRTQTAHKKGGKQCKDKKLVKTIRAIGKQIVKEVGKKLLTGNFNLTQVSFPIRAMIPKSALEKALQATCLFPLYMNKASSISDPVERMKLILTATIGCFYINCSFLKPLNPILGETISAHYCDGTELYAEQIQHHPPVSYFLALGPKKSYKFYGYYLYEAKAGLNSLVLKNKGKRFVKFSDGQIVQYNYASEEYSGSFWGAMKVEVKGKMKFEDKKNSLICEIEFDNVRWKASDYFQGEIKLDGKRVCKVMGSYMGFIEFDKQRYWDFQYVQPYQFTLNSPHEMLKSDHSFRKDKQLLVSSNLDAAQKEKEALEEDQRKCGKLRKQTKSK